MSSWLNHSEGIERINSLGSDKTPFLFILSYDKSKIFAEPLDSLGNNILYQLDGMTNHKYKKIDKLYSFTKIPLPFVEYKESFEKILEEIRRGNTYLLNLTFQTPIETTLTLKEIFTHSKARFKLYFKDEFICFSPEEFIRIESNSISTYPMKGTIEASIPNAKEKILSNPKEMAEHTMIVDLMRNDLGIVGESIEVERFRYVDKIVAGDKELLQVSSHIKAKLEDNWSEYIGSLLDSLTPAGSITGTPKKRTQEIIKEIEEYDRGFYTGIFGIFDGSSLYSGVMIRFIESNCSGLTYKSGGGVTIDSVAQDEYREMIDKVYLPF